MSRKTTFFLLNFTKFTKSYYLLPFLQNNNNEKLYASQFFTLNTEKFYRSIDQILFDSITRKSGKKFSWIAEESSRLLGSSRFPLHWRNTRESRYLAEQMRPIIPAAFASCVIFNDKEMLRLQGTSEINRDKVADGKRKGKVGRRKKTKK